MRADLAQPRRLALDPRRQVALERLARRQGGARVDDEGPVLDDTHVGGLRAEQEVGPNRLPEDALRARGHDGDAQRGVDQVQRTKDGARSNAVSEPMTRDVGGDHRGADPAPPPFSPPRRT